MRYAIFENTLAVQVDRRLYPEDVVFKCFYWYQGGYDVEIELGNESEWEIVLRAKEESIDWEKVVLKIQGDLVDFKLRDIVTKETLHVRDLIVAKAFAYDGVGDVVIDTEEGLERPSLERHG
jgi:His-Xaa-Ser system protein HxsD